MEKKKGGKKVEYAIYVVLLVSFLISIWSFIVVPPQRLLAISVMVLILGCGINMLIFYRSKEESETLIALEEKKLNVAHAALRKKFTEDYTSDKMREGVKRLANFERRHGSKFPEEFVMMLEQDTPGADELSMDSGRLSMDSGRVAQHFDAILTVFGKVDDEFVRSAVNIGQVKFLLDIIEPMEKTKNPEYDKWMFDEYKRIFKEDLKER